MADVISRQAAIDEVNRLAKFFWEKWHEYAPSTIAVTDALKEIPSAQQWIPCDERLPEEDGVYIVTTSKGQVQLHVFNTKGNSKEYWMRCNKAWMPLPEPFKEATDDLQK